MVISSVGFIHFFGLYTIMFDSNAYAAYNAVIRSFILRISVKNQEYHRGGLLNERESTT